MVQIDDLKTFITTGPYAWMTWEEKFWLFVNKRTENECWNWRENTLYKNGYGKFRMCNLNLLAHRISYLIHYGNFINTLFVCHTCDNPPCVNPKHLFLGTHLDNMKDMVSKNRGNPPKEFSNYRCKLSNKDISCIRDMLNSGKYLQKEIAKMYGVRPNQISRIHTGARRKM